MNASSIRVVTCVHSIAIPIPIIRVQLSMSRTFHYLSDGLETRMPPYYKVKSSVSAIIIAGKKISQAVRSYKGCLEAPAMVNLTMESASVRASTVDHSRSTMGIARLWVLDLIPNLCERKFHGVLSVQSFH